jgi:hypothetical protein
MPRHFCGLEIFFDTCELERAVPNVIRFPPSISKPAISSEHSAASDIAAAKRSARDLFVSVALFSAAGLLVSLVLLLLGVPSAWY